jgi:O-antigen/teichoic acid export membrane protein
VSAISLGLRMKDKFFEKFSVLNNLVNKGHDRSIKAKKNIIASFLIKCLSIGIGLLLVRLTIDYINPSRYGIWLTLSSIVAWFSFFDIGLTQGLRNKFAAAVANGEHSLAQIYVSTTYAILAIIFSIIWILFFILNHFLDWAKILNISESMRDEVSILSLIVFTYFCLQFVFRIITTIITADQQPAKASLIDLLGQILSLTFVVILVKTTQGSLIKLGIALCVSPLLVLLGANFFFFQGAFKKYKPVLSKVKFSYAKGLFNLGVIFFIIQVAGIIQYETANIIIARSFGTTEVTSYNIVYKYFGMLTMIFTIFLTPFWSASTEAYQKNDIQWIKNGIRKYNQLNLVLVGVGLLMLIFSNDIYSLWLGKGKVTIPFSLSVWGFLFFNAAMFCSKYVYFLNGISALRIQFWASVVSPFLYIIVAIVLIRYYHFGVYSLFIASVLANFNGVVLAPIQYHQVINRNKKGIWVK